VPCIDVSGAARVAALCCAVLAACSSPSSEQAAPGETPARRAPSAATPEPAAPSATTTAKTVPAPGLAAPGTMRNWTDVRRQAAHRLVAANPAITYMGRVPDQLLAIPVLEIELNRDGSVRRIAVLREPRQAKDTLRIATDAVHRAAPYGDVSRLPRPWKFVETFLFDDNRKFKPRTLDD
jgi:hypothetical protein